MAEGITHPVEALALRPKLVCGRFFPNGTSTTAMTVSAGTLVGKGIANVTRTASAGVFTVTLDDTYVKVVAFDACVQHTTAADLQTQFGAFSNVGTGTNVSFTLRVLAGATGTDITANADSSVSFWVLFEDSGAG